MPKGFSKDRELLLPVFSFFLEALENKDYRYSTHADITAHARELFPDAPVTDATLKNFVNSRRRIGRPLKLNKKSAFLGNDEEALHKKEREMIRRKARAQAKLLASKDPTSVGVSAVTTSTTTRVLVSRVVNYKSSGKHSGGLVDKKILEFIDTPLVGPEHKNNPDILSVSRCRFCVGKNNLGVYIFCDGPRHPLLNGGLSSWCKAHYDQVMIQPDPTLRRNRPVPTR